MAPARPLEASPQPEEFLKGGAPSEQGRLRVAKNSWFPVYCSFVLAGVRDSRILEIRAILVEIYKSSGIRGLATTIKRWAKATRVILENNPRTIVRGAHRNDCGYSRSIRNWTFLMRARNLASEDTIRDMIGIHGEREIPPFFMDPLIIRTLMRDPSRDLLERLVILSNLGRTQPSPDKEECDKNLRKFKTTVESPRLHTLRVRQFVARCFQRLRGKGVTRSSHWSVTGHSSLEYTRRDGGKTQEIIDKVLHEFMHLPITAICPNKPDEKLQDITGATVIDPEFWDPTVKIGEVVFPEMCADRELSADARLGHIGLLWSLWSLQTEGFLVLDSNQVSPGLYLGSTPPQNSVVWSSLPARVEGIAEEGWKCRVITITSMAATVLGHVARHLLDPVLVSDQLIRIGMRDKVKLWSLLRHIGIAPAFAESVDLTTATDVPPREIVQDVLHGVLDGVAHPLDPFLRVAADVACSDREFSGRIAPRVHNRGIMMGEPLSGIFLNGMTYAVRNLIAPLMSRFPETAASAGWSNAQCDAWILERLPELQEFLDSAVPHDDRLSSQSGDDNILFSNGGYGNATRVAYRIFELTPSEFTWYESDRYAIFTEEAAIRVADGKGWKFVDSIKPRTFVPVGSDPDTIPILGKLALMSSYLRYIVEDYGDTDERYVKAIRLADLMISQDPRVIRPIRRDDLAVGLPRSLGGILHPVGLQKRYVASLKPEIQRGIWDFVHKPPLEILRQEFLAEDPERGVDPKTLEILVSGFFELIESYEMKTLEEVALMVPEEDRRFHYKVLQAAKAAELKSIQSCLDEIVRNCTFLALLQGQRTKRSNPMHQVRRAAERLRTADVTSGIPSEAESSWNSTDISKFLQKQRNSIFLPAKAVHDYMSMLDFPSMRVDFNARVPRSADSRLPGQD